MAPRHFGLRSAISLVVELSLLFFHQSAHIFGSLIQTIDSVMAHMTYNLDENSLPLTVEGMSSVAGMI